MTDTNSKKKSTAALLAGVAVFLVAFAALGFNFIIAAVLAVAAFFAVQFVSPKPVDEPAEKSDSVAPTAAPEMATQAEPTEVEPPAAASEPSDAQEVEAEQPEAPDSAAMAGAVKLGTILPGEAELAEKRGTWRYEG